PRTSSPITCCPFTLTPVGSSEFCRARVMSMGETKGTGIARGHQSHRMVEAWKALLLILTLASATVVAGCAGVVSASKSPDPGTGAIQLNPTTVNFGNIAVGKQSSQTVTIANTGTASISVT